MNSSPNRFVLPSVILLLIVAVVVGVLIADAQPSYPPPDPAEFAPDEVVPLVPSPSPAIYGKLWWDAEYAQRDLDLIQDAGFTFVKQDFAWREIESHADGQRDFFRPERIVAEAYEHELGLIVRVDRPPFWTYPDYEGDPPENTPPTDFQEFEDFCFFLSDRLKGQVFAYQVWNEPNLSREWGDRPPDPAEYTQLLRSCRRGLNFGDPEALIISAPLAPTQTGLPLAMPDEEFLRGMYEAGADEYFDMLGVNAPGFAAPPQLPPEAAVADPARYGGFRFNTFRHVEDIRRIMVEYDDAEKQIAIMEMGWTSDPVNPDYTWFAVSEEQKARYLREAYEYAAEHWYPWVGLMTTIYMADPAWTPDMEQYWWAITEPSFPEPELRPAYHSLSDLFAERVPVWNERFYSDYPDTQWQGIELPADEAGR